MRTDAHRAHGWAVGEARARLGSAPSPEPATARGLRERRGMSQRTVQLIMGWLLTDEDLRLRFAERPRETLDELREQGYELTVDELDALVRSDPSMWPSVARRIHPRLQRCRLREA